MRRSSKIVALSTLLFVARPVFAQSPADPIDPDLAAAAKEDEAARGAAGASATSGPVAKLNPDLSLIMSAGFGWFGREEHLLQGGHAMDENGFALQGLELAASASVDPYFRFDLSFELRHQELEEVYLTTLALPASLQARAGYFNVAFGRQNPQHLHTWNFANPPLSHTRFMSEEHFRGTGAELSRLLPLPWYSLLLAEVMTPSEASEFNSATFGTVEQGRGGTTNGLEDLLYVGRLENFFELSTDWSLLFGASAAFGQSPYLSGGRAALYGSDLYFKWRPLAGGGDFAVALTLEALLRDSELPEDSLRDWGGYAQLDFFLSRRFMLGARGDYAATAQGALPEESELPRNEARGSLAFTFLPSHFSKLRLQADLSRAAPGADWAPALFLQAEVSAGEHGAHKF